MDPYQETFDTWNKVATLYQDKFMNLDLYNDTYDAFCGLVNDQKAKVLEVGCGPGNITKYLLGKQPGWRIKGTDIAPNMIALARKNNPAAQFEVMDSRQMGELTDTFDGIVCGFCLPYLSETDALLLVKNCYQLLSQSGVFYLSFVEGDYSSSGYQTGSSGDRTYFYYYSLDQMKNTLMENGFQVLEPMRKHYPKKDGTLETHTILIAKK